LKFLKQLRKYVLTTRANAEELFYNILDWALEDMAAAWFLGWRADHAKDLCGKRNRGKQYFEVFRHAFLQHYVVATT